jgi:hypothetical protein
VPQIEEVPVTDPAAANIVSQQNPAPGREPRAARTWRSSSAGSATAEDTG